MRIPVPKNKVVAFTLVGAVLTAVVAAGLAFPIPGVTQTADATGGTASMDAPQAGADVPMPNQDFTPAVQTQSVDEEHEEYEAGEHEDDERYEDD